MQCNLCTLTEHILPMKFKYTVMWIAQHQLMFGAEGTDAAAHQNPAASLRTPGGR